MLKMMSKETDHILESAIEAVQTVLPLKIKHQSPSLMNNSFKQSGIGVLIGLTGDINGRLLISGSIKSFGEIGSQMFGMPIADEMVGSFSSELANMIAGNLSTIISRAGVTIDITPPTIFEGESTIQGFEKAILVPILGEKDQKLLNIIVMVEGEGK